MLIKKHCVYVHRRKDNNEPFYIGCCSRHDNTRNIGVKRYRRAFDFKQRRPRWFEVMGDAGGVNVEIAFVSDDKNEAFKKEKDLVDFYGREAFENGMLVNECLGGVGAPGQYNSTETRRKKARTKLGKMNPMYGRTGQRHPTARVVVNGRTGMVYESVSDAAEACGYKMKTLYNYLSGHRKNPTDLRFV
jgi:hypothetical protein